MTEGIPAAAEAPPSQGTDSSTATGSNPARRAQFLATEHWSLLATRSMSWNESFARTGMFLTSLSTATVSLALVGSATSFGPEFVVFALVVLSITLFLGVATFVRLSQVNNEDLYWVAGMNRLRRQYAMLEPGIEDEFVAGISLDATGFAQTYGAMNVTGFSALHVFVTTPGVIAVVCSAIAAVIAALVAFQVAPAMASAVPVGLLVGIASMALFIAYAKRDAGAYIARMIRFQDSKDASVQQRQADGR
ncbi:MAG: hypothetical protein EPO00_02095 [Chloroflexota bacterium]|nr:MAG: hypothetical protein EPO00_02095 [Chloroflexota bacterium]